MTPQAGRQAGSPYGRMDSSPRTIVNDSLITTFSINPRPQPYISTHTTLPHGTQQFTHAHTHTTPTHQEHPPLIHEHTMRSQKEGVTHHDRPCLSIIHFLHHHIIASLHPHSHSHGHTLSIHTRLTPWREGGSHPFVYLDVDRVYDPS